MAHPDVPVLKNTEDEQKACKLQREHKLCASYQVRCMPGQGALWKPSFVYLLVQAHPVVPGVGIWEDNWQAGELQRKCERKASNQLRIKPDQGAQSAYQFMYREVSVKHVCMQAHPNVPVVENMEDIWKVGKLQRERERKAELAAKAQARKKVVESATKAQKITVTSVPKDAREEGNIKACCPV